jgi:hypothetical protein
MCKAVKKLSASTGRTGDMMFSVCEGKMDGEMMSLDSSGKDHELNSEPSMLISTGVWVYNQSFSDGETTMNEERALSIRPRAIFDIVSR